MVAAIRSRVSYLPGSYLKVKELKKYNFSCCFMVCEGESWFLIHPKAITRSRVFEDKVLRIFACEREEVRKELEVFHKRTCFVYAFDQICMINTTCIFFCFNVP